MKPNPRFPQGIRRSKSPDRYPVAKIKKVLQESRVAWAKFLNDIDDARSTLDFRENEECWFRGQKSSHQLTASLFRLLHKGFNSRNDHPKSIYELEYNLYFESAARSPELQASDFDSWDILSCMRHHGLPTRLLDWTERLGVALFFALEEYVAGADQPVIWLLNPYKLNEIGLEDRDLYSPLYLGYDIDSDEYWSYEDYLVHAAGAFDWNCPVAIYPTQKNARMRSQMGWFTVWGKDIGDLDRQCPQCVRKVPIPEDAIDAAVEFLAHAGIDYSSIYPGLDGFARMIKDTYHLNPVPNNPPGACSPVSKR